LIEYSVGFESAPKEVTHETAAALVTKAATAYLRNKLSRAFKGRDA
jgi:NADPH:quinone reductase-like Zn-dependent oxidoreductase